MLLNSPLYGCLVGNDQPNRTSGVETNVGLNLDCALLPRSTNSDDYGAIILHADRDTVQLLGQFSGDQSQSIGSRGVRLVEIDVNNGQAQTLGQGGQVHGSGGWCATARLRAARD